jgi:prophage regulatory protein
MDGYLRLPPVKATTGLSKATLYRLMDEGHFPRPYSLGARAVGWLASEVEAWVKSRRAMGPKNVAPQSAGKSIIKPSRRPPKAPPLTRARSRPPKPTTTAVAEPLAHSDRPTSRAVNGPPDLSPRGWP